MTVFAWSEFLELAAELGERTGNEAAERTAIGRCYYAVFCTARQVLRSRGERLPGGGAAHVSVWNRFHGTPDLVHRRIADRGRRLRRRRGRADYEDTYPDLTVDAQDSIDLARRLLADLDAFS